MDNATWWGIALGVGAVVLLVVLVLLLALYRNVRTIDSEVATLVDVGGGVAADTTKIRDLLTTAAVLKQIRREALIHYRYFARQ